VVDVPELGAGSTDEEIATYAVNRDRLVLTSDTDFLSEHADHDIGVLFQPDETLPATRTVCIVEAIDNALDIEQVSQHSPVYVSSNWLR